MTSPDSDMNGNQQHGDAVRRTYAGVSLSPEQRERHKQRLRETAPKQRTSRLPSISAETAAIAAVALLLVVGFAVWQSLDPRSDDANGSEASMSAATTAREQALPFHPPDTCPVDTWAGPENRLDDRYPDDLTDPDSWSYSYFLDGSGISLNARLGLLYKGGNTVFWLTSTYQPQDITYSAENLDGDSGPATFSFGDRFTATASDEGGDLTVRSATIDFPEPGCWQITVASQDAGLRQIVYVYPEDGRQP